MSLRFPSGASPTCTPLGERMRRVYAPSGRVCLPPMKSFGVRSIGGSALGAERSALSELAALAFDEGAALRDRSALTAERSARRTYSHIPSRPPSRPKPDSRYPPNPAAASNKFVEFTQ